MCGWNGLLDEVRTSLLLGKDLPSEVIESFVHSLLDDVFFVHTYTYCPTLLFASARGFN